MKKADGSGSGVVRLLCVQDARARTSRKPSEKDRENGSREGRSTFAGYQGSALIRVQGQSPCPPEAPCAQPLTFSVPISTDGLAMLPWVKSRSLAKATMDFNTS